jgi:hypothetical protein
MARVSDFPGCCSVTVLHRLNEGINIHDQWEQADLNHGSGRFVAIIGDHQGTAYTQLCAKYKLESQSNPFMGNHGRKLIVCVFKIKKDKK